MNDCRHVAVIAPPWYPLPPEGYGGIELVVALLVSALRRAGVRVSLFGCEGSMEGTIALAPRGWHTSLATLGQSQREQAYAARVLGHLHGLDGVDVIHDHTETSLVAAVFSGIAPVVHTVHGPITPERSTLLASLGRGVHTVAISAAQKASAGLASWAGVVHNSVDVEALITATDADKEGYLLCLARICHEKAQHRAIEVARRTGRRLVLAGKVGENAHEQRYFRERIAPHIDGDRVVYHDNIVGARKARIIAGADALIHPVAWPEPFGLAMVEAMVSGTPVVGIGLGAVPELIEHGVTGFVAEDVDGLVDGVHRIGEIDIARCAALARGRWHPGRMAAGYMAVYEAAMDGAGLDPSERRSTRAAATPV